ncbi:adenine phosphoribosyltransferase [Lactobacillus sp. LC28-10]|uniref:Adenine phosphoribosyltransferase n=1 Tax=Secundilactobacillus angelensis TaxID=2722706 RepID=A0ABX1KYR3_9LACO|nr:phosphoribosyltransferase family protein [Secundilactobacillus angelensis]MCH5462752.1 adenine phosphoribosyltransferase [Secundilactobacillus angelensis]NLR19094.1 adenine phosphoribosyltransferase [Secundilactobacillus angelensis]
MPKTYHLQLGPLERDLPLITLPNGVTIASFVLLGDAELTHYAAEQLLKKIKTDTFDYFVTVESKGIPLAQEITWLSGHKRYIVLRKAVKDYMVSPLTIPVEAITTSASQQLVLDGTDAARLKGKRVIIVDDVISSGGSLQAAEQLMQKAGAQVVDRLAVLAEGSAKNREDIKFLGTLPLF